MRLLATSFLLAAAAPARVRVQAPQLSPDRPPYGRWEATAAGASRAVAAQDGTKPYLVHVTGVEPDARYNLHDDGSSQPRVTPVPRVAPSPPAPARGSGPAPTPGRYGCLETRYRVSSATFEFEPRGFLVLARDGAYEYTGTRSRGHWRWDAAAGAVRFAGGRLDGARAVQLAGSAKWRVELPTGDPERPIKWSCRPVGGT